MIKGSNILIVESDEESAKTISNILQGEGYDTELCFSGECALELIQNRNYDLVLLDVKLSEGMTGYQTCMAIQKLEHDLPIILVTSSQNEKDINRGFQLGSSDYIKKPVSKFELLARVSKTISFKRSEKNNLQLIYDLSKDLETAAKIQEAMLPKWIYLDNKMIFSSHYEAYEAVGGDVFDRIKINDDLYVVYLGDISGHGVQAALLMTAIKSIIKIMVDSSRDNFDLPSMVTHLNERLSNELFIFDNYLTLLIGVIDLKSNEFQYLNAGHPPIVMIDINTGEPTVIESTGSLPLGWLHNHVYHQEDMGRIPLSDHNIILLFSDGIYECLNPQGRQFGIEGILSSLQKDIKVESCISLPFKIKQYLVDHKYSISSDDFSLLTFQKRKDTPVKLRDGIVVSGSPVHFISSLKAALREVGKTAQKVEELILAWKGNRILAAKVELIIDEFLNNIVKYGYNYQDDATIVIEFEYLENKLLIRFWDKGIEWNPEEEQYTVDNPYDFEKDVYNVDGKGVKIIMSISNRFSRVRYDQLNETTVEIEL